MLNKGHSELINNRFALFISDETQHAYIVALSANAFEGDRDKYMVLGMDEYLTKPINKKQFIELLNRLQN